MQLKEQQLKGSTDAWRGLIVRLKRFALILSGDEARAAQVTDQVARSGHQMAKLDHISPSQEFSFFKQLYDLWLSDSKQKSETAVLFEEGHENEAIQKGLDPAIAILMGALPSRHRAMLLLIYGEDFSYVATAQLLNMTIEELMMALSSSRAGFCQIESDRSSDVEESGRA